MLELQSVEVILVQFSLYYVILCYVRLELQTGETFPVVVKVKLE
jgi:hypothetical protein